MSLVQANMLACLDVNVSLRSYRLAVGVSLTAAQLNVFPIQLIAIVCVQSYLPVWLSVVRFQGKIEKSKTEINTDSVQSFVQ